MVIGGFNVIISMDWLSPNHVEILFFETELCLPLPNGESSTVFNDKPSRNLRIISCMKAKIYLQKKYYAFLAYIVDKKNDKKRIEEVPQVCNYPDVFPEDLPGLLPA